MQTRQGIRTLVERARNEPQLIDPLLCDLATVESLLLEGSSDLPMPLFVEVPRAKKGAGILKFDGLGYLGAARPNSKLSERPVELPC